jgi:transcriptional regulator with XRE-family HTH domain
MSNANARNLRAASLGCTRFERVPRHGGVLARFCVASRLCPESREPGSACQIRPRRCTRGVPTNRWQAVGNASIAAHTPCAIGPVSGPLIGCRARIACNSTVDVGLAARGARHMCESTESRVRDTTASVVWHTRCTSFDRHKPRIRRAADHRTMATRDRRLDRARRFAMTAKLALGRELRVARINANLSQRAVREAAGMSRTKVGRIEDGHATLTIEGVWALAVPLGLDFSARLYPSGDPVRDKGHLLLLERLRSRVHPDLRWRTEVPFPNDGDLRAWDAVVSGRSWWCAIEAEARLDDLQALDRKLGLKQRDGRCDLLVLLVPDTRHNRQVLSAQRQALIGRLPFGSAVIVEALREGRVPPGSGIVVL